MEKILSRPFHGMSGGAVPQTPRDEWCLVSSKLAQKRIRNQLKIKRENFRDPKNQAKLSTIPPRDFTHDPTPEDGIPTGESVLRRRGPLYAVDGEFGLHPGRVLSSRAAEWLTAADKSKDLPRYGIPALNRTIVPTALNQPRHLFLECFQAG